MPEHELSQYLAWLLASAHRQMKMGIAQSIADEEVNEEHWRILQVVSDEQGHSMGEIAEKVLRLKRSVDAHHDAIEEALGPRNSKQLKRLLERLIEQSQLQ